MWSMLLHRNTEKNLNLRPEVVHLDFVRVMHNAVSTLFPDTRINCCRFHLGQCWWIIYMHNNFPGFFWLGVELIIPTNETPDS